MCSPDISSGLLKSAHTSIPSFLPFSFFSPPLSPYLLFIYYLFLSFMPFLFSTVVRDPVLLGKCFEPANASRLISMRYMWNWTTHVLLVLCVHLFSSRWRTENFTGKCVFHKRAVVVEWCNSCAVDFRHNEGNSKIHEFPLSKPLWESLL
jgi:hypothetical protein